MPSVSRRLKQSLNRLGSLDQYPPRAVRLPQAYGATDPPEPAVRISIVTPSLNQGRFVEAAIASVVEQEYPAVDLAVCDGGSSDGTVAILERRSPELAFWRSRIDDGQATAINEGFHQLGGEIMGWLNADDVLLSGSLCYVASYFAQNPDVDVVYGHRLVIDAEGREIGRQVIPPHTDGVLSWADFVPQETMFWRRSAWEAAGGRMDESFDCAMDWELLVRLRDSGARMVRLPRFLGAFRLHGDQKTLRLGSTTGLEEMRRIRRRIHGREVEQTEVLRRVRGYLLRHVALDRLYRLGLLRY